MISKRSTFKDWKQISPLYIRPENTGEIVNLQLPGQTDNVAVLTLDTPQQSGLRRITGLSIVTTPDGVASVMPSATISWTDADSGVAQTAVLLATSAGDSTTTSITGSILINAKQGVPITITGASYASTTPNKMTYSLYIVVEAL